MLYWISAVILWLSPYQSHTTVAKYADLVAFESKWYKIDPLLVLAFIQVESGWNTRKKSITNDYGLMQVHVARIGSARFYGHEKELYNPRVNIREGVRILAMWKQFHEKYCKDEDHPFWAHNKWGRKVKTYTPRVDALYARLTRKFGKPSPTLLSMKGVE